MTRPHERPVLLLHSSGLSGRQWKKEVDALTAEGLSCLAPDLTGHGASEAWPAPRPFSFTTDVKLAAGLLDEHGPVHLVGHSYGGFIAAQVALARPERVASLALYDPVAFGVLDRARDADALAELHRIEFGWGRSPEDVETWLQTFVDYWGGPGAWAALRDEARAEFRRVAWVVREGVRTLLDDETPAARYADLPFPVRLATGEKTPLAGRRVSERLAEAARDGALSVVSGAGHMGPLTHAAAMTELVRQAIRAA